MRDGSFLFFQLYEHRSFDRKSATPAEKRAVLRRKDFHSSYGNSTLNVNRTLLLRKIDKREDESNEY
jgi:hypothetical protein